jgi:hypothetical protein
VAEEGTVDVAVHTRELLRIVYDAMEHYVEFIEKPQTQAGLLVFRPHSGNLDVEIRLRLDDKPPCHSSDQRSRNLRSMSVRTSVQSRPALGLAWYARQALANDFPVPLRHRNVLRRFRDPVPERLYEIDLPVDREIVKPWRRRGAYIGHGKKSYARKYIVN